MVKVMYSDQFVHKVVIWAFFEISLWTEKVAIIQLGWLKMWSAHENNQMANKLQSKCIALIISPITAIKCKFSTK